MEQEKRKEFKSALRERILRAGALERRKETIGSIPMRALDPLISLAVDAAVAVFTPEPGEEISITKSELAEMIRAGNRLANRLRRMSGRTGNGNLAREERAEIKQLIEQWEATFDEDDEEDLLDDDEASADLTAHPQLRVKDWEQIWFVLTGGKIHDYDGFEGVSVDRVMYVEEFRDRLIPCTIKLPGRLIEPLS